MVGQLNPDPNPDCPDAQVLMFLRDGGYLSGTLTESLTAQLVSYNPDDAVIGYWKATFTWAKQGIIRVDTVEKVQTLCSPTSTFCAATSTCRFIIIVASVGAAFSATSAMY